MPTFNSALKAGSVRGNVASVAAKRTEKASELQRDTATGKENQNRNKSVKIKDGRDKLKSNTATDRKQPGTILGSDAGSCAKSSVSTSRHTPLSVSSASVDSTCNRGANLKCVTSATLPSQPDEPVTVDDITKGTQSLQGAGMPARKTPQLAANPMWPPGVAPFMGTYPGFYNPFAMMQWTGAPGFVPASFGPASSVPPTHSNEEMSSSTGGAVQPGVHPMMMMPSTPWPWFAMPPWSMQYGAATLGPVGNTVPSTDYFQQGLSQTNNGQAQGH